LKLYINVKCLKDRDLSTIMAHQEVPPILNATTNLTNKTMPLGLIKPSDNYMKIHQLGTTSSSMFAKSIAIKMKLHDWNMTWALLSLNCPKPKIMKQNTIYYSNRIKKLCLNIYKIVTNCREWGETWTEWEFRMRNLTKESRLCKVRWILKNAITRICEIKSKNKGTRLRTKDSLNERLLKSIIPSKSTTLKNKVEKYKKNSKGKSMNFKILLTWRKPFNRR